MSSNKKYDSSIESLRIIITNLEENAADCRACGDLDNLKRIELDIEEHKDAIIALQMIANGKLRVI